MARQRTIIGLGEALLVEHPNRLEPGGLGGLVAVEACRLRQRGVLITRIGQDEPGDELQRLLREHDVDTRFLQYDPDLPTGRTIIRPIGPPVQRHLESRASYDNLQWDFDLEDAAQLADLVIYGLLSRRSGQTRSEENRFLDACSAGVKIADLTHRPGDEAFDRGVLDSTVQRADVVVLDDAAARALLPVHADEPMEALIRRIMGQGHQMVIHRADENDGVAYAVWTSDGATATGAAPPSLQAHAAWLVAMLTMLLRGRELAECCSTANAVARQPPDEPLPDDVLAPLA